MKKIIIFSFLIISISNAHSDEYEKYRKAFDYISSDSVFLTAVFAKTMKFEELPEICVSNQIIFISNLLFIDSLYMYEHGKQKYETIDGWKKDSISRIMDSTQYYDNFIDSNLSKVFYNKCNGLIIFFSKILDNKLKANVLFYKDGIFDYELTHRNSLNFATYLFHFKKSKIKKVFRFEFIR